MIEIDSLLLLRLSEKNTVIWLLEHGPRGALSHANLAGGGILGMLLAIKVILFHFFSLFICAYIIRAISPPLPPAPPPSPHPPQFLFHFVKSLLDV
jgi:hypothetical protein